MTDPPAIILILLLILFFITLFISLRGLFVSLSLLHASR
jgi:hypothetical protein